jgi:hypothetical protein
MVGSKRQFKTFGVMKYLTNGKKIIGYRQVNITKNEYYGYDVELIDGFKTLSYRNEDSLKKAKNVALNIINKY